jgi:hypothetical protein
MKQPVLEREEHAMSNVFEMALFEPEVVLPAQISWGARRWRHLRTRELMLAILEDAILCIERGRRRRHHHTRQLAAEAESWVCSDSREADEAILDTDEVSLSPDGHAHFNGIIGPIPAPCTNPLFLIRIAVPAGAAGRWIATGTERTGGN